MNIRLTFILIALALIAAPLAATAGGIAPDGQIFLKDYGKSLPLPSTPDTVGRYGQGRFFITSKSVANSNGKTDHVLYERPLLHWKDPLTLPHSRASCVKWASGRWPWPAHGGWKTCIGWKTQFQWMYVTADLRIAISTSGKDLTFKWVRDTSNTCLSTGAVAAAVAAIYSGGQAAANTFAGTVKACFDVAVLQMAGAKVNVAVPLHSHWGGWE